MTKQTAKAGLLALLQALGRLQVVASNETNREMNNRDPPVFWPERSYKWGVSEAFNPEHSDLMYLRRLLLEDACEEIAASKRKRCAISDLGLQLAFASV